MRETLGRETPGDEALGDEAPGRPITGRDVRQMASDARTPTASPLVATPSRAAAPAKPAKPAEPTHAPNKLVVTGAVIVCVAVFAVLVAHLLVATNSSVDRTGAIGTPAPDFTITVWNATNGTAGTSSTLSLTSLQGRPIVLDFWSPTSLQSQQMAQSYEQLAREYAMFGVAFVGVAVETPQSDGQAFLQKNGLTFPNGADPTGAIATAYGLPGLPDAVFINSQGVIVDKLVGLNTPDELDYIIRQDLLDGIPPLPTPKG